MKFRGDLSRWVHETFRLMSREEARMWESARTLVELGEMMAGWLEGRISARPGYNLERWSKPDPETEPLIDVLAGLCRLGFVTENSQPGVTTDYTQTADLFGFASPEIVQDMYRMFRDVPDVEVHARPVAELGWRGLRTEEYAITSEVVSNSWSGPIGEQGWDAIQESWVVALRETEPNERGLLWSCLARYIQMRRNGIEIRPLVIGDEAKKLSRSS